MSRFLWYCAFIVVLFISSGCGGSTTSIDKQGDDGRLGVSHVRQLVTADNKTSRTLMWQSSEKQAFTVEYRLQGENAMQSIAAGDTSLSGGNADPHQYMVRLTGLQPGRVYEYRVRAGEEPGGWHILRTDNGRGFTALIFPDSQSSDYSGWQELARSAQQRHSDAALYINMGDLVDNGQDASQWRAWLNSVEPFSDRLPLAPVLGNHEAYSLEWKTALPQGYRQLFAVPDNGLPQYPRQFYSFDYGPVHFIVLDTNFSEMAEYQPQLLEDELRWLERDLVASTAKWKVVLQHRDVFLYGFGPDSGRAQTQTHFLDFSYRLIPVFEKYQVDAVLSAHLHTYRRRVPLRQYQPDPDGITYILTGVAGSVRYPQLWGDFSWDAARAPQPETANYMLMQAADNELTFKAFLPDGRQFDEATLRK